MIRVNLLEGTAEQRVTIQKTRVAARRGQQLFMLAAALLILALALGVDHLYTNNAHARAAEALQVEEAEAKKLEADIQRKADLENEIKQIEERIKVIQQLRAEQKGPVAMLNAINERMPGGAADFRLTNITQKGNQVQISGLTLDERVVGSFVKQLEFSNNLFTSLSFAVIGKDVTPEPQPAAAQPPAGPPGEAPKPEPRLYEFKITCNYNKPRAPGEAAAGPAQTPAPTK